MGIKAKDNVKVDYEGRLENGEVFDSSKHGDHSHPLEFVCGSGMVIKGFDDAVIGMNKGEEKEFKIEPKEAYGEYNNKLIQKISVQALPKDQKPEVGMYLVMSTQSGQQVPAVIKEVNKEFISIDLNHPLAGKKLIFKIKVVEFSSS